MSNGAATITRRRALAGLAMAGAAGTTAFGIVARAGSSPLDYVFSEPTASVTTS